MRSVPDGSREHTVRGVQVERFGIKALAQPLELFGCVGVFGVAEGVDEGLVARDTSAILWRTGALARKAAWIGNILLGGPHRLNLDVVFPVVAEVVDVPER